jgi:hypothetical protein
MPFDNWLNPLDGSGMNTTVTLDKAGRVVEGECLARTAQAPMRPCSFLGNILERLSIVASPEAGVTGGGIYDALLEHCAL